MRLLNRALDALFIETGIFISAAEGYPPIYRKAKMQYAEILRIEQQLNLTLRQYFNALPGRIVSKVNWQHYQIELMASDVEVDISESDWQNEADLLLTAIYPPLVAAMASGVSASDSIYGVGVIPSDAYIQQAAADHGLKLVTGLNDTTKADVLRSIQTSLKLHETYDQAANRLESILDSGWRAEMIARTETVKAYQLGVLEYGKASGALSKTWQVSSNPCNVCEPMSDETVGIDSTFSGGEYAPPQHPNCRCGVMLNFTNDVPIDYSGE